MSSTVIRPSIASSLAAFLSSALVILLFQACSKDNPVAADPTVTGSSFTLTSPAFQDGGTLPRVYTCDSTGYSPPLAWTGSPAGAEEFALMMTTIALDGKKWNWVLYGIHASVAALAESTNAGTAGLSTDGPELRYYSPCSSGPGAKTYTFTLYALSGSPVFSVPPDSVTGAVLTSAISQLILDSCQLNVSYTRDSAKVFLASKQRDDISSRCGCRLP